MLSDYKVIKLKITNKKIGGGLPQNIWELNHTLLKYFEPNDNEIITYQICGI